MADERNEVERRVDQEPAMQGERPPLPKQQPSRGEQWLAKVTSTAVGHPWPFVLLALVVVGLSGWLATGLEIRSSFEELLPSSVPSVAQVKMLLRRVGGDGTVTLSIELKDSQGQLEKAEALADTLGREFLTLGPNTIRSVEWNVKATETYYENHWPLFVPLEDLKTALRTIDEEIAKLKQRANPLNLDLDADEEPEGGEQTLQVPWLDPKKPMPRDQVAERFKRYPNGYLVHSDGRSVTVLIRPTGSTLGVDEAKQLLARFQAMVERHRPYLDENHLRVGFGGTFATFIAEYEAILRDVASTAFLCVSLVLMSLLLFYRDLRSTLSLAFAMMVAVAVTFGITRLTIGYLNTQTAFLGSIVVGNGINYGLIYLARVRQLRRTGIALLPACLDAAPITARATLLAALATSVSFGMLILAANRGFRHFGIIGGIGMLLCWLFTFLLVPAALSVCERISKLPVKAVSKTRTDVPRWIAVPFSKPRLVLATFAVLSVASAIYFIRAAPRSIEKNLINLTNELSAKSELIRDNARSNDAFGHSTANAIALLPSWEIADGFCAVIRERVKWPAFAHILEGCDTFSSVVPRDQQDKLNVLKQIVSRLTDSRLKLLTPEQAERAHKLREDLQKQTSVTEKDAPGVLVDRFRERDGTLGTIAVVTARSDAKLEHGDNIQAFAKAVRGVQVGNARYDATGENVVFADLLTNIEQEGPLTTFGSLIGVCVLVVLFFRRAWQSFAVITVVVAGVVLMAAVATLCGVKINFFNFIVFPITFGIAVDYGANILVRIQERQGEVLKSLLEVGPAVILCSWTTMIGYGTLIFAVNRALRSFGWYAVIGEVTSIVAALFMLPAMALWLRHRMLTQRA